MTCPQHVAATTPIREPESQNFFCKKAVDALRLHQRGQAAGAELHRCHYRLLIYKQVVFDHVAARAA